jgi:hypothetical protein
MKNSKIYSAGLLATIIAGLFVLQPILTARAGDCLSYYKSSYLGSKKPHKAFATTSGARPNSIHPVMVCGAADSNFSRQAAESAAMRNCSSGMKNFHLSIPCGV